MSFGFSIKQLIRFRQIKQYYEKYERVLLPAMLVFGVCVDWFTFTTIDTTVSFILLGVYIVIAGSVILFSNAYDARKLPSLNRFLGYLRLASPLIIQFLFGALLSAVFIFYVFSGTLFVSWPLLGLLVLLMVSNDVFRHYYLMPLVQVSVYFFIVFSYLTIIFPFIFNSLAVSLFVWSAVSSVVYISLYIFALTRMAPTIKKQLINFVLSIFIIFTFINGLYFLNIIPPIPLSIREVNISHGIVKNAGGYMLKVEQKSWWKSFFSRESFQKIDNEGLSVYTAIFAPKNFRAKIIHHWQWYDTVKKEWVSKDRLSFTLSGGRKEGFRGYSTKTTVPLGKWRVYVETERGQVLGRVSFDVLPASDVLELKDVLK